MKKYHGLNYILAICIMPIVMFLLLTIVELIRLKILGTFENNLVKCIYNNKNVNFLNKLIIK